MCKFLNNRIWCRLFYFSWEASSISLVFCFLDPASGSSMDWVKSAFKVPITYTYELRDTGRYGFVLPPEQIIPTGEEILDSLVALFEEAENIGYKR